MELGLTATITLAAIQYFVDVLRLATALVFVEAGTATHTTTNFYFRGLWMKTTVAHLCDRIVLLATVTLNEVQVGPNFPVDFLPANSKCFTDERHEFLKVPIAVNNMLSAHLAVSID